MSNTASASPVLALGICKSCKKPARGSMVPNTSQIRYVPIGMAEPVRRPEFLIEGEDADVIARRAVITEACRANYAWELVLGSGEWGPWSIHCPWCGTWVRLHRIKATKSAAPCGPKCTEATGNECKCSCMGRNHGKEASL